MTDKEILIEMFNRNKIKFTLLDYENIITIEAGYVGFASDFYFDKDDNLQSVEAYE